MANAVSSKPVTKQRTTWAAYLEASSLHRERLIASEKARLHASILLDSDYDRIAGWMSMWRARYYDRYEVRS